MTASRTIGLVGLGTMGRSLALNFRDRGVAVLGYDPGEPARRAAADAGLALAADPAGLVAGLPPPRCILLMVPAGPAVDAALDELSRHLAPGDVVIDGGNSHWRDSERRAARLAAAGLAFVGAGISGGEEGARFGPAIMIGAEPEAFARVQPLFEAVAARAEDGTPCWAHFGPPPAGHLVKTVHNGIEYAIMQALAEVYDLARRGHGLELKAIADLFESWQEGPCGGFLLETGIRVLRTRDPETGRPLLGFVRDRAEQKGTGGWTAIEALELGVPAPTLVEAVQARSLSAVAVRAEFARLVPRPAATGPVGRPEDLEGALLATLLAAHAQGLAILAESRRARGWPGPPAAIPRVWRAGCILRGNLLAPIVRAFERDPELPFSLLDDELLALLLSGLADLRTAVADAARAGVPVPALSASLAWLDGLSSPRLPADLVQAMRDRFGAHGFERIDRPGRFHDLWRGARA
ncbi:MAG: 6-phosphogluconate dehydrogenase, decarboxylating [Geminicoccaceae bacterium]|nr:MAG: 6-phosphogluconate dehydrogenase, decarboxylating [Geminicoccaceae bacterium]